MLAGHQEQHPDCTKYHCSNLAVTSRRPSVTEDIPVQTASVIINST